MACVLEAKRRKIDEEDEEVNENEKGKEVEVVEEEETEDKGKAENTGWVRVYEDDDDDDYDEVIDVPPPRPPTQDELDLYYRQVFSSQGFDAPKLEGVSLPGRIWPCPIDESNEQLLINLSNQALKTYNDNNGASFEFDHIIKVTGQIVSGCMYFITFAALCGETCQTFRGKVWEKLFDRGTEVKFCEMVV